MRTDVQVGIITYRGHKRVAHLLESIDRRDPGIDRKRIGIVVLDDGSPSDDYTGTVRRLYAMREYGYCVLIRQNTNRGIAASWNRVCRYGVSRRSDYLILLNDDVLLEDRWLEAMLYFLEHNPHMAAASWKQHFFDPQDVAALLEDPSIVFPRASVPRIDSRSRKLVGRTEIDRPRRVMVAAGSAFGFTRRTWDVSDPFPEAFKSFFEESHFGTLRARLGKPSYEIPFPSIWHQWSATFNSCPELMGAETLQRARHMYCQYWGIPRAYRNEPFDWIHPKMMASMGYHTVRWLGPDGVHEALDPPCACRLCRSHRRQPCTKI